MTTGVLTSLTPAETAALTRRVTALSVGTAAVLAVLKCVVWLASGSVAVMASMADSALDLIASLATFYAVRFAVAPPDSQHRFGYGKVEAFASLLQAGLVFSSAALIGREAVQRLIEPAPIAQEGWAVAVMVVSMVLTFGLLQAQTAVLRKTASVAVSGDRAHYFSDLASNLVALIGLVGAALLGIQGLDAAAGLAIAGLLVWGAIGVFREAAAQLMDRELPDEARRRIVKVVTQDPLLTHVHQLRTRASGPFVHIQMHVDLDPELSFEAAHKVIDDAERRLVEAFPSADVIIHADPRGRAETHSEPFSDEDSV